MQRKKKGETTQQGAPRSFSVSGGSKRASTNQLRSFQLDKKEYPVVSQNDLGAPFCVVSPQKNPVAFLLCDPGWFVHILYRNMYGLKSRLHEWDDKNIPRTAPSVLGRKLYNIM